MTKHVINYMLYKLYDYAFYYIKKTQSSVLCFINYYLLSIMTSLYKCSVNLIRLMIIFDIHHCSWRLKGYIVVLYISELNFFLKLSVLKWVYVDRMLIFRPNVSFLLCYYHNLSWEMEIQFCNNIFSSVLLSLINSP